MLDFNRRNTSTRPKSVSLQALAGHSITATCSPDKTTKSRGDPYIPNFRNNSGSGDTQMGFLETKRDG